MAYTPPDADLNAIAKFQATKSTHLSLHEADPGKTGASEATGGTPAYARQPVTWGTEGAEGPLGPTLQPATVGRIYSNEVVFDVDPATYSHWGGWDAATAGGFHGGDTLDNAQVIASQGQIKLWVYIDAAGA